MRTPIAYTRKRTAIAALLTLAVLLAACQGPRLDPETLEREIETGLEAQAVGVDVTLVDCPDDVEPRVGDVFACRAESADGTTATIEVTQVDDEGNVEWVMTAATLDRALDTGALEARIRADLEAAAPAGTGIAGVECPSGDLPGEGGRILCQAVTDGDVVIEVTVEQVDAGGTLTINFDNADLQDG